MYFSSSNRSHPDLVAGLFTIIDFNFDESFIDQDKLLHLSPFPMKSQTKLRRLRDFKLFPDPESKSFIHNIGEPDGSLKRKIKKFTTF